MRLVVAIAAVAILAGCNAPPPQSPGAVARGRYAGIGTYSPGELWSRMAVTERSVSTNLATTADDEHIIVVVDGQTGEVRECGDYSGVCVTMNPWTNAIAKEHTSPVALTKHRVNLEQEQKTPQPDSIVNP